MSKILTTQLTGLLQRIEKTEEEMIGDTARVLAQAGIGEGIVYFACFGELEGIMINALYGADPFKKAARWTPDVQFSSADRVIIFSRSATNEEALALARELNEAFIPFSAVASEVASADNELSELAYTYISLKIRGGILPHPEKLGERIVFPHLMAALYVYEALKMEYDEMVEDDEEVVEDEEILSAEELHGNVGFNFGSIKPDSK
jgi:hypothetical protein